MDIRLKRTGLFVVAAGALAVTLLVAPAAAETSPTPTVSGANQPVAPQNEVERAAAAKAEAERKAAEKAEAERKAEAEKKSAAERTETERKNALLYQTHFGTQYLTGGIASSNDLYINVPVAELYDLPAGKLVWKDQPKTKTRACPEPQTGPIPVEAYSKKPDLDRANSTIVGLNFPAPPCWWPLTQTAELTITGTISAERARANEGRPLFAGPVTVSVFWFPFAITLLTVLLIYPGCAMASWYASRLHYRKVHAETVKLGVGPPPAAASFWESLDPVELTKNAFGRASIGKMQIFFFTLIVFALLLFHQLRTGSIAAMSTDVLMLLGISAVGAAGGKIAMTARRRLGLDNWAWLRRKGWLPAQLDTASRAKWSELFLDGDTQEFDPYSFQMAIFSLVVAVALVRTSFNALGTFSIPPQLLALLGISQVVYIGGQAIDKGGYQELDKKLDDVRAHEKKFQELITKAKEAVQATPVTSPTGAQTATGSQTAPADKAPTRADAEVERKAFKADVEQAAAMFWGIYGEQLGEMPPALKAGVAKMEPELYEDGKRS